MSRVKQFAAGFGYIGKGFSFFVKNKRLWPYAVIPTMINLVFLIGLIFLLTHYYSDLTGWIFGENGVQTAADIGFFAKVWQTTIHSLVWLSKVIIFIILMIFVLIITFVLSLILTEPFNDALSEKVEQALTGKEIPFSWSFFLKSIKRSIIVALQKALFFILIPVLLLILNIIPGIGSFIYLVLANLFAGFDIGFNFVDYPMSRKLWTFKKRIGFAWQNKFMLTGFGIVVLIPLFPYIFAAPMVAGGTLMFNILSPSPQPSPQREREK